MSLEYVDMFGETITEEEFSKKPTDEYRSKVFTDRPAYADFDSPAKFQAIMGIIALMTTMKHIILCGLHFTTPNRKLRLQ